MISDNQFRSGGNKPVSTHAIHYPRSQFEQFTFVMWDNLKVMVRISEITVCEGALGMSCARHFVVRCGYHRRKDGSNREGCEQQIGSSSLKTCLRIFPVIGWYWKKTLNFILDSMCISTLLLEYIAMY